MKAKKERDSLSDLYSQMNVEDLQEPEIKAQKNKKLPPKQQVVQQPIQAKKTAAKKSTPGNILDTIKEEEPEKPTRITLDLDKETYTKLKRLVEYTGKTQAKLLRALIVETEKLLRD